MTGAGMMDCKKALNETNGDMDEAIEYLRKNGQAKAEKKAGRIAREGLCQVVVDGDCTAKTVVEVNSETDFVAKNEKICIRKCCCKAMHWNLKIQRWMILWLSHGMLIHLKQ